MSGPSLDPEFYEHQFDQLAPLDLAALVWNTATAFTALAEPEPDEWFGMKKRVAELETALKQIATDKDVSSLQSNSGLNPRHIAIAALTRTPDGKEQP